MKYTAADSGFLFFFFIGTQGHTFSTQIGTDWNTHLLFRVSLLRFFCTFGYSLITNQHL